LYGGALLEGWSLLRGEIWPGWLLLGGAL
jgi:hypothetical protein